MDIPSPSDMPPDETWAAFGSAEAQKAAELDKRGKRLQIITVLSSVK